MKNFTLRIRSIDVFRALTMFTMIFVNDLWTLKNVPSWMEHSEAKVDFLGFSDIVFPCFLFILGMAIPPALRKRLSEGESTSQIVGHIAMRSAALIIMGIFTVNVPGIDEAATGISSQWYKILMITGFFLVWNVYPEQKKFQVLPFAGLLLLAWLFFIFKQGTGEGWQGMTAQWWGILGLIGWAYFGCALLYLFTYKNLNFQIAALLFFLLFTIAGHSGWLKALWPSGPSDWILGNGAFHAFTYAGIMAQLLSESIRQDQKETRLPLIFAGLGVFTIVAGLFARNHFIISKILATPTWILLCTGIALILYGLIYFIADLKGKAGWFDPIKAAGTQTLTCYLIPYVWYSVATMIPGSLPEVLKTGPAGLLKSLVFSFIIIQIAGLLSKAGIRIKI